MKNHLKFSIVVTSILLSILACGSDHSGSSQCQIANCHGPVVQCAHMKEPIACTEQYEAGDRCRTYASCVDQNNTCELVITDKYHACLECVNRCKNDYAEPIEFFQCEATC